MKGKHSTTEQLYLNVLFFFSFTTVNLSEINFIAFSFLFCGAGDET